MARGKTQNATIVDDVEEMTVVVLKLKGRGETLRKGFDTVSQAFAAVGAVPAPQQRLTRPATPTEIETNGHSDVRDSDEEAELGEASEAPAQRESTGPKKHSTPKFLDDFKLDGDGTRWKDYAPQKNPKNESDRYLVACAWVATHGGQPIFTRDHVFTCFRTMNWTIQADFTQPMRALKRDKSYFTNPERGKWKLTDHGLEMAEAIGKEAQEPSE